MSPAVKARVKSPLLLATVCGYLFLGGYTFAVLEHDESASTHRGLTQRLADFLANHSRCGVEPGRLRAFLENSLTAARENGIVLSHSRPPWGDVQDVWKLSNAFVFAFEVVTTIGSGVRVPRTFEGRLFTMVYAAIGVPLCCLMLSAVGDTCYFMWRKLRLLFARIRRRAIRVALGAGCTLAVSHTVLTTVPAVVVASQEGWNFFTAQYYCFMVTSTVGLGDLARHSWQATDQSSEAIECVWKAVSVLYDLLCLSIVSVILKGVNEYRDDVRTSGEGAASLEGQRWAGTSQRGDGTPPSTRGNLPVDLSFKLGEVDCDEGRGGLDSGECSL